MAWLNTSINNGMSECNHCNGEQVVFFSFSFFPFRSSQQPYKANVADFDCQFTSPWTSGRYRLWSGSFWSSSARMLAHLKRSTTLL